MCTLLTLTAQCRGERRVGGQPLWLRRASAASRYALGACSALMAWALRARAPAASLITASCSALGATRYALEPT